MALCSQASGSNLFLHQITSGTCESHGVENIRNNEICFLAADYHGYKYNHFCENCDKQAQNRQDTCLIQSRINLPSWMHESLHELSNNRIRKQLRLCDSKSVDCQCTPTTPCFCQSKYFVEDHDTALHRKIKKDSGEYMVTWSLSLAGKDFLLESKFLKAGFEQSVKDYINNDIFCSSNLEVKGAEFIGVEIVMRADNRRKMRAVSGNGKCRGDIKKCKVPLKAKREQVADDDLFDDDSTRRYRAADASKVVKATHAKNEFCEIFLQSTIFDAFKERLITASFFNYNVNVDVINDLEGNLDLNYDVTFVPSNGNGLDQMDDVSLDAEEPTEIRTVCIDSQCTSQKSVMRDIFKYFDIPFDDKKHECLYQGINCNVDNMVTHIWMGEFETLQFYLDHSNYFESENIICLTFFFSNAVNYGFEGKTIPELFSSLPFLSGLFLGEYMFDVN